jgi:hypothetical protein
MEGVAANLIRPDSNKATIRIQIGTSQHAIPGATEIQELHIANIDIGA